MPSLSGEERAELGPRARLPGYPPHQLRALGLSPTVSLKPCHSRAGDSGTLFTETHRDTQAHTEVLSQTLAH